MTRPVDGVTQRTLLRVAAWFAVQVTALRFAAVAGRVDVTRFERLYRRADLWAEWQSRLGQRSGSPAERFAARCVTSATVPLGRFAVCYADALTESAVGVLRRRIPAVPRTPVDETPVVFTVESILPAGCTPLGADDLAEWCGYYALAAWTLTGPLDRTAKVVEQAWALAQPGRVDATFLLRAPRWAHWTLCGTWVLRAGVPVRCQDAEIADLVALWSPDPDDDFHDPAVALAAARAL